MNDIGLVIGIIGTVNALLIFFIGYIQKVNNERFNKFDEKFDATQEDIKSLREENKAILLAIKELQLTKQDYPHIIK